MINLQNEIQRRIEKKLKRLRSLREDLNISGGLKREEVRKIKSEIHNLEESISKEQNLSREVL